MRTTRLNPFPATPSIFEKSSLIIKSTTKFQDIASEIQLFKRGSLTSV